MRFVILLCVTTILLLQVNAYAQQKTDRNKIISNEIPKISGGAEYSLKHEKVQIKNLGFNAVKSNSKKDNLLSAPLTVIEGINFNEDANNTGFYHIPPDPHMAAGPDHIVDVVNTSIEWHTKTGVQQHSEALSDFFTALAPTTGTFDPKVIYDQYDNRFIVIALEVTDVSDGDPSNTSKMFIGVSDDDDPNGTWYTYAINAKVNLGGNDLWADYPGLAVGDNAVYITVNMFEFEGNGGGYGGAILWIIDKNNFYDGGAVTAEYYDAPGEAGVGATTMQPAHMFGSAPGNTGTFLVRYSAYSNGTEEFLSIIRVDDPLGTPGFSHQFVEIENVDNTNLDMPEAPQQGSAEMIETNDRRTLNAVWRSNALYITTQVVPPSGADAGEATALWVKVNTSNLNSLFTEDYGTVGGEDIASNTYTFFPSVAVDSDGNMGIGFSASGSNIYPGAYYTGRLSTDPAGTVQTVDTLAEGKDYYYRKFGGSSNRWGDYSGIAISPDDDITFWVFNEYALTRGTITGGNEDGRWGTRNGNFQLAEVQQSTPVFTSVMPDTSVNEGGTLEYNYIAIDPDNGEPSPVYSLVQPPDNASINSSSGLFTFSPDYTQAGTHEIIVRAEKANNSDIHIQDTAIVTVNDLNRSPFFTSVLPDTTITAGFTLIFNYEASDPDSDEITFSLVSSPAGAVINTATGEFSWTPDYSQQENDYEVVVMIQDNGLPQYSTDTSSIVTVSLARRKGDVSGDGELFAFDAVPILQHVVGLDTLESPDDLYAADVNSDGMVGALDASWILYAVVHQDTFPDGSTFKLKPVSGLLSFGDIKINDGINSFSVPLILENSENVYSMYIEIQMDEVNSMFGNADFNLPDDWLYAYNCSGGVLRIGLAGVSVLKNGKIAEIEIRNVNENTVSIMNGSVLFNDAINKEIKNIFVQQLPEEFDLSQNYPNPFNPSTAIGFQLSTKSFVTLKVYDMLGREVKTLVNEEKDAGSYTVLWDGENYYGQKVTSGTYIYRISAGDFTDVRKMILLK